jgi:hypothetical protein
MDIDNGAHFCGFVSRMTKWMDLSAIVISPSKIEENQELKITLHIKLTVPFF